jgi:hypothetical protein
MKKSAVIVVGILAVALLITAGCDSKPKAPSINMTDGLWEMTMKVDMPGMSARATQPRTITMCLTKNDLIPQNQPNTETKCEVKNRTIIGDTVTWETVCPNLTSKGSATYAGTTFSGSSETTINMQGKTQLIKTAMTGRHIGVCPEKKQ